MEVEGSPFRCTIIGADAGASSVSGDGLTRGLANSLSLFRVCLLTKVPPSPMPSLEPCALSYLARAALQKQGLREQSG
jgi:hypothetical protein